MEELQPLTVSNPLLDDPDALRSRFGRDGYIFLRATAPIAQLRDLRRQIVGICARHGWLKPGSDPMDAISWTAAKVEGEDEYFAVYDEVQALEAFHALSHEPAVVTIMKMLLGPTAFPHPLSICRLVFPDVDMWTTPPHQDFPNNQGTPDLYACWIPLADCPREAGSLSILEGSHHLGLLPTCFALGAGERTIVPDERVDALVWRGGDFALGDMIIFHSLAVHRSEVNRRDRMRVSVDYRFQREGEPVTDGCLKPHFARRSWSEIYRGWTRDDLKYYWHGKDLPRAEWDSSVHEARAEDERRGIWAHHLFDERRKALAQRYAEAARDSS